MSGLVDWLYWGLSLLQVAVGLGFVIFWHELGHFALAKWNRVKVEKFSVGFGKALWKFRRGETEYALSMIPLGGFVAMLGEHPGEEGAEKTTDPRAFGNKSVGARMAIISAGVIMNVILGLICFVTAYKMGLTTMPAVIGAVGPGGPAYKAGLKAGDEVVAIDGRRDISFKDLQQRVMLSAKGEVLHLEVKRPGVDGPIAMAVEPRSSAGDVVPSIEVSPALGLGVEEGKTKLSPGTGQPDRLNGLEAGDRIVAAAPTGEAPRPVSTILELQKLRARGHGESLDVRVERPSKTKGAKAEAVTVTLPPIHIIGYGARMTAGPLAAVQDDSPAKKAGFREGDKIVAVDGETDFDPMRLPFVAFRRAGETMTFRVARAGAAEPVEIRAVPTDAVPWQNRPFGDDRFLDVPGLGLAFPVLPTVASVEPGSPAEKAGVLSGQVFETIALKTPDPKASSKEKTTKIAIIDGTKPNDDDDRASWLTVFRLLQLAPPAEAEVGVAGQKAPLKMTPRLEKDWYSPTLGFVPTQLAIPLPPQTVASAIRHGAHDTVESIQSVYLSLRGIFQRRISRKGFGGPLLIFDVGRRVASTGLAEFVQFLGLLSVNLAVINFLPVPPLDGGQMIFLIAEKVRGRPLPERALNAGTTAGIALVIGLMVLVLFQDVIRLNPFNLWKG